MMDRDTATKIGTGEAHAHIAEAWFTFLGFVAATAVFHAAAEKNDSFVLLAMKWTCYALLFRWVQYKIDLVGWALFPSTDPTKKKATGFQTALSVWVTSMVMLGVYFLVFFLIKTFLQANAG